MPPKLFIVCPLPSSPIQIPLLTLRPKYRWQHGGGSSNGEETRSRALLFMSVLICYFFLYCHWIILKSFLQHSFFFYLFFLSSFIRLFHSRSCESCAGRSRCNNNSHIPFQKTRVWIDIKCFYKPAVSVLCLFIENSVRGEAFVRRCDADSELELRMLAAAGLRCAMNRLRLRTPGQPHRPLLRRIEPLLLDRRQALLELLLQQLRACDEDRPQWTDSPLDVSNWWMSYFFQTYCELFLLQVLIAVFMPTCEVERLQAFFWENQLVWLFFFSIKMVTIRFIMVNPFLPFSFLKKIAGHKPNRWTNRWKLK